MAAVRGAAGAGAAAIMACARSRRLANRSLPAGVRVARCLASSGSRSSSPPPQSSSERSDRSSSSSARAGSGVAVTRVTSGGSSSSDLLDDHKHHLNSRAPAGTASPIEPAAGMAAPAVLTPATALVDSLLRHTATLVDVHGSNVIAYSGGVDSSLVAALVYRAFTGQVDPSRGGETLNGGTDRGTNSSIGTGSVTAVLGLSPAVPPTQIATARHVARNDIGVPLLEIPTNEGSDDEYVRNEGTACFVCKTHLYETLGAVARAAAAEAAGVDSRVHGGANGAVNGANGVTNGAADGVLPNGANGDTSIGGGSRTARSVVLFNGTNYDDTHDPTRLGLVAAHNFCVRSPLLRTPKSEVRRAARHLGLSNWNHAAAPCLRSRLELGVEASREHLRNVGEAEGRVREMLKLDATVNMRVRMLAGKQAMVEIDSGALMDGGDEDVRRILEREGLGDALEGLGFTSYGVRAFRSGSVAKKSAGAAAKRTR